MVEAMAHPKWLLATNCSRCWVLQHRRLPSPSPQPASRHLAAQKKGGAAPQLCVLPALGRVLAGSPVTPSTGACAHPAPARAALQGAAARGVWGTWWFRGEPVPAPPREGRAEQTRLRATGASPSLCKPPGFARVSPQRWPLSLVRGAGVRWAGQGAWHEAFLTPGLCSQRHLGFPGVQPVLSWF